MHILPRFSTDFKGKNDDIYPALESSEQALRGDLEQNEALDPESSTGEDRSQVAPGNGEGDGGKGERGASARVREVGRAWEGVKDEDRRSRNMEEMEQEALWLQGFF